ncbi:Six-hairpin glycosidase-like protein [Kockovaella imperatae]|uniref:Six-hairpin glycosidase-like protein n=1 Tax=Kockovaella imperatae TaxID=4999 RepID=A0A1Y1U9V3_9TREE|nr:Six-hairpin glycosidase-like protein [Kockovaella imperatae]ORX34324.1 Six-hairpin glycosidase-like protein [Kockovaella imperatae]
MVSHPVSPAPFSRANILHDAAPAENYSDSWLIGNGRLGAGVQGQVEDEKLRVNEESIWAGGPQDRNNPDCKGQLAEVKRLVAGGNLLEAERLSMQAMAGNPTSMRYYDFLGMIHFIHYDHHGATGYERSLNLDTAVATVKYKLNDVNYTREYIASHPKDLIAVHIRGDRPASVNFSVATERGLNENRWEEYNRRVSHDCVVMGGQFLGGGGHSFAAGVKVFTETGHVKSLGQEVEVTNADEVTVFFTAWTTYRDSNPHARVVSQLNEAAQTPWSILLDQHIADHHSLFSRVDISFGSSTPAQRALSISDRVKGQEKLFDPELTALHYQFGRYCLIASSRPGTLPATLQGIWSGSPDPQWGCRYTTNINLQMNYWLALQTNLFELNEPLLDFVLDLSKSGQETARKMYGARGAVCHHNANLWGDCAPQDRYTPATVWPTGLAWLCTHIWEHYLFSGDITVLRKYYPAIKEASLFFLDAMTDHDGYKVTSPSLSPENSYMDPRTGLAVSICAGPTLDNCILWDLFSATIHCHQVLDLDDEAFILQVSEFRSKLPPIKINRQGGIQEWLQDYVEAEIGHRHYSSLYGMYPGSRITPSSPTLFNAARTQLHRRIKHNSTHTGWSAAWAMALAARAFDADIVAERYKAAHEFWVMPRTLIAVGGREFQLDSTFGFPSAMTECILQSHETIREEGVVNVLIRLLPSLPTEWAQQGRGGHLSGVRARGGFIVDVEWNERGELVSAMIEDTVGGPFVVTASRSRCEDRNVGVEVIVDGKRGVFVKVASQKGQLSSVRAIHTST